MKLELAMGEVTEDGRCGVRFKLFLFEAMSS